MVENEAFKMYFKTLEKSIEAKIDLNELDEAIELYEKDPNFYWLDWEENEKLLDTKKEEN